jgi:ubiquinone biosynthesis protein
MTAALFEGLPLLWSIKAPSLIADASLFGGVSYLMAAYLGWRLLRAIKKSADIDDSRE